MAKTSNWNKATILLTGGTDSFGIAFIRRLLKNKNFQGIIRIFSRDEYKQFETRQKFNDDARLRFLIGDVRDLERVQMAARGVDIIIHAAALKQVPALEYNPFEAVKTNILGSQNIVRAAIDTGVKKAILISSDKACYPVNLYGATKMTAEKLFIQGNSYAARKTAFSVIRYGNVLASRGSVVPAFIEQQKTGQIQLTDKNMTRFWITLDQATGFVEKMIRKMKGGEIFIPKLPSIKIIDLVKAIAPKAKIKIYGIRPGEKIAETLVTEEELKRTLEYKNYFVIQPEFPFWKISQSKKQTTKRTHVYCSDLNDQWLTQKELKQMLK